VTTLEAQALIITLTSQAAKGRGGHEELCCWCSEGQASLPNTFITKSNLTAQEKIEPSSRSATKVMVKSHEGEAGEAVNCFSDGNSSIQIDEIKEVISDSFPAEI
jgi:hypothetical protein